MTIRLPLNGKWTQPNTSDKFGSIARSKNINLDKEGYLKLSPRMVNLFDSSGDVANSSDSDFGIPVAFGKFTTGEMYIATIDEPFDLDFDAQTKTIAEDSSSNNPNLNSTSHGVWWQNRFYESTDTGVSYNTSGTWTASAITGLTSGKRHAMAVFKNKNSLAVSDGNTVKLYDTSHSNTVTLTLPSDFEVIGLAYNNYQLGIITRLGGDSAGQNAEAYFFTWNGASTEATTGVGMGSYTAHSITSYKSSFVILEASGRLLYFNGGGFDKMAQFPFYQEEYRWGNLTLTGVLSYGDNMVVEGDVIYINVGFNLNGANKKLEDYMVENPSGIWCYDPEVGLYHRYSPSISKAYLHTISEGNIDTTTNIFTTAGVVPPTGNPILLTLGTIGGLSLRTIYYIIRLTATTFKLATTKQNALDIVEIDLTSKSGTAYLITYDLIDYGASFYPTSGAIGLWGTNTAIFQDVLCGNRMVDTAINESLEVLSSVTPYLENRGYFVTPKMFLSSITELVPKIYIKHEPLDLSDSIIVKAKRVDLFNIPTTSPNGTNGSIAWTSSTVATTDSDLSEAKTAFDAGFNLELELTAGVGAGQMVKITNLTGTTGAYTITVEDEVIGASSGLRSHFIIENWEYFDSVTYSTQKEGVFEVSIARESSAIQFKIELRGYKTSISELLIPSKPHKPNA